MESFAEWYRRGALAPMAVEARLPTGAPAQMVRAREPAGHAVEPACDHLTVQLVLEGRSRASIDLGAGRFGGAGGPGTLAIAPAGSPCDYSIDSPHEVLIVALPAAPSLAVLREASGGRLRDHGRLHAGAVRGDDVLESIMRRLWTEAEAGSPMGILLAEDAATALAARLARLALRVDGLASQPARPDERPLQGWRLARVLALIGDRLGDADGLRQSDLAAVSGLSAWHFCRAFKAATGTAPHRYVTLRRLAEAQRRMARTSDGLARIAAECGFAHQSHLTRVMRRETGQNPASWRRAIRT